MNLEPFCFPRRRKTLVILGAGASFGSVFSQARNRGPRPPLDMGFFSELQRASASKPIEELLHFVRENFGASTNLSMEEFFSQVEYTHRFHQDLNVDRGPKVKKYQKALESFYESIPVLFNQAIGESACKYHEVLASKLGSDDVVMSFNYDCIIDTALKNAAGNRWDPSKDAYGFPINSGAKFWASPTKGPGRKSSITLLKPHGSLNWNVKLGAVSLERRPYSIASAEGRIIPPTWFKNLLEEPFASVWKRARIEIRACRALIVIGYSLPKTDLFSSALLKVEAGSKEKREKLDLLVLVNPDRTARERFLGVVAGGIEPHTRIVEFDFLEQLYSAIEG